jgi:hypothetical protein
MKLFVSVLMMVAMCGCSEKQDFSCVDHLAALIPPGTSATKAEQTLKECNLEYSIDKQERVFHAIKRGKANWLAREDRVVVVKLDSADSVTSVEIKREFTGL